MIPVSSANESNSVAVLKKAVHALQRSFQYLVKVWTSLHGKNIKWLPYDS